MRSGGAGTIHTCPNSPLFSGQERTGIIIGQHLFYLRVFISGTPRSKGASVRRPVRNDSPADRFRIWSVARSRRVVHPGRSVARRAFGDGPVLANPPLPLS